MKREETITVLVTTNGDSSAENKQISLSVTPEEGLAFKTEYMLTVSKAELENCTVGFINSENTLTTVGYENALTIENYTVPVKVPFTRENEVVMWASCIN